MERVMEKRKEQRFKDQEEKLSPTLKKENKWRLKPDNRMGIILIHWEYKNCLYKLENFPILPEPIQNNQNHLTVYNSGILKIVSSPEV